MLCSTFSQLSFADIDPDAIRLDDDAIERILHDRVEDLASLEDFAAFYHPDGGSGSLCPLRLFAMLVLQYEHKVSDSEVERRSRRDLGWKYAMRLGADEPPPSLTTLKRFRTRVREQLGADFVHQRVLRLAEDEGLLDDTELQAVDSTNADCRGAILDTFNLIARGIANVLRQVADWTTEPVDDLAERLGLSDCLARSIKGHADIDWTSKSERNELLTRLVRQADWLVAAVRSPEVADFEPPPAVHEGADLLWQVAHQDVEQLADGSYGIRRGTAKGRVISITDPQARHGRKSSSKVINGHKVHVLATIESQFVTAILITDAGVHDAVPCADLLRQADGLGLRPSRTLGDLAYGTGENRRKCAVLGTAILTKVARSSGDAIPKSAFDIDLGGMRVTCPAGQSTERYTLVKAGDGSDERVPQFVFEKTTCAACPEANHCCANTRKGGPRKVKLSPFEAELQESKAFNRTPEAKPLLRKRCGVERIISHLVRLGMRAARYFGQQMTQFQAYMVAGVYNLKRVATLLAARRKAAGA